MDRPSSSVSGCRTNEARTLKWEQLDTDEDGTIWVNKTKNGEPRTIRLAKAFYPMLDRLEPAWHFGWKSII